MRAKSDARHLDLVAFHPVLVTAYRVDLAVMRKTAERLGQPPLRECVGGITLVEHGNTAGEAFVLQVGVEYRQAFGQK